MQTIKKGNLDTVKLHVVKKGQGPPLIFIHGWAASHHFWKHQIPFFAKTNLVIAYDLRGHGDSEESANGYQVIDHVYDLERLLDANQISQPVLIGHSLGGMIALQYTLEHSSKPRALVLVGTSPRPVASWKRSIQFNFLRFIIRISRKRASKFTEKELFAPDVDPELVNWVNAESLRTPNNVILQVLKDVKSFDVLSRLSDIDVPTLLLIGEFDTTVEREMTNQMQMLLPKAQIRIISNAGHNCMLENFSQFNSILNSYLQEWQIH